jgi:large repetitive protein
MRNHLGAIVLGLAVVGCGPAQRGNGDDGDDGPDANNTGIDAPDNGNGDGNQGVMTFVYAHTSSQLYRVDPDTLAVSLVGNFTFPSGSDQITDIAIDKTGLMIGISFTSVYRIDPSNAACTTLSQNLSGLFNGLSFVPATEIGQTGADVLVATRNSNGAVFRVDPMTGNTTQIGNMGNYASSGDLVSVATLGTLQTADNGVSPDRLLRLAPNSFAGTPIGTTVGFGDIWGIAYWKNKVFGFTEAGEFITIDPNTGAGTLVQSNGPRWWGAAVTTLAPVIF